ncbi:MAG: ATP-NAD kinase family protein [Thermoproteales archaeon]|nr:ATP-NAD kinase family protein [Thermoproteales archaeon]
MRIGFLVNPIAGIGGRVGLKGSDGVLSEALKRGGVPLSPIKARLFFKALDIYSLKNILFLTASGKMGEIYLNEKNIKHLVVYVTRSEDTNAVDTINTVKKFLENDVSLIVFVGGDGTARDICSVVANKIPIIGIPAGVKVYSGVFGYTPADVARLIEKFISGEVQIVKREIIDANEDLLRKGILKLRLYGYAKTISYLNLLQPTKTIYSGESEEENKDGIAKYIFENIEDDTLYILGPGSTIKKICEYMGLYKDDLSVDILLNKKIIDRNVDEKKILKYLEMYPKVKIIVTPIGRQGFIFGRGNQEISPLVLQRISKDDIIVVATRLKMNELKSLRIDTGNIEIDKKFKGYIRVIVDYNEEKIVRIV